MAKRVVKLVLPVPKRAITMAFAVFPTLVHTAQSALREATKKRGNALVVQVRCNTKMKMAKRAASRVRPVSNRAVRMVCGPSSISDFGHTYCEEDTSLTVPTLV
jgi:hypothetical protein